MRNLIYILALFLFSNSYGQSNIKVGEIAPKINITNWIQNVPEDKELKNNYIVLEFWATWCGPCIAAVPHMNKIQDEFNSNDLYYISLTDESVEKVERSLKRISFNSIVATDLTKETQILFGDGIKGLDVYPLTVLIDKNGIIKWVGKPKDLNSSIMSKFLSKEENQTLDLSSMINIKQKETKETFGFKELMTNKNIKQYFEIKETKETVQSKSALGTSIINLKSYKLEDIYNVILNIKNEQLRLPEFIKDKRYNLIYKNTEEPNNLDHLEDKILKELKLKKKTNFKISKINIISVKDQSLLEETLEKRFSAKSDADDKIIFTAYTINAILKELSNLSSESFKSDEKDETKYDFIIDINSKNDIINSLNSYGLEVTEKDEKVEYIELVSEK